jgi:hypothetical protein
MLAVEKNKHLDGTVNVFDVYRSITYYIRKRFSKDIHPICTSLDEEIANFLDEYLTDLRQEITISDYNSGYSVIFLSYPGSELNYMRHVYDLVSKNIIVTIDIMSPRAYRGLH